MTLLKEIRESVLHLFFPHVCEGCGTEILAGDSLLCLHCLNAMPETNFHLHANNPIEKMFWGRITVTQATAQYYFSSGSMMQHLMHQLKYHGNRELGIYLGQLMGECLRRTNRFQDIDALVPLPLFPEKERKRGYNQAELLCNGMSAIMKIPVITDAISRPQHTETQTKKGRLARWQNIEGKFFLLKPQRFAGKHVLLVDDVVTTGATLEASGEEILKAEGTRLSIATLCYTAK